MKIKNYNLRLIFILFLSIIFSINSFAAQAKKVKPQKIKILKNKALGKEINFLFQKGVVFVSKDNKFLLMDIKNKILLDPISKTPINQNKKATKKPEKELTKKKKIIKKPIITPLIITDQIRIGEEKALDILLKDTSILQKNQAVIKYSEMDLVALSTGSTIKRDVKNNIINYQLNGLGHIFILESKKPVKFILNGLSFQSQKAHLFINTLTPVATITLIDGDLKYPNQKQPIIKNKKNAPAKKASNQKKQKKNDFTVFKKLDQLQITNLIKTKENKSKIVQKPISKNPKKANKKLSKKKDKLQVSLIHLNKVEDPFYKLSLVDGFEMAGSYKVIGKAIFTQKELNITRYKNAIKITTSPAFLLKGDEIKTVKNQLARLELISKDKIFLKADSNFKITEFIIIPAKESITFNLFGKIRSKIAKRKKFGRIRFKTATAVIGIKGTEFDLSANEKGAEVATLEGKVGVSDPSGKNEVIVDAGMETRVEKGKPPEKPKAIPPERLKSLKAESFEIKSSTGAGASNGPKLIIADYFKSLKLTKGTPLNISWSAPINEVEVKVNDKIIKATLADNNKQLQLDAKEIFKLANNAKKIKLSIKAKGEKGTTLINQEIPLSYPPEGPIKLEVGNKNKNIFTNKLIDIKVKTDRNIASYEIFIDNKKIDLELKKDDEKKPTQEKTPKNQITIKKGFLKNLKEGNNAFKIVVKDLFDKTAEQIITINLDKTTPNLVALQINPLGRDNDTTSDSKNKPVDNKTTKNSASLNQKAFPQQKVNEGDDLKTFWSEPINSLEISQAEKKQKIVFEKEQKEVIIKSDQIKNMFLNKNKGVLKLTYIDQAGNKNQTDLKILFIKKPTGAPKISFNSGKDSLTTNPSKIISIKSNRLIKKWIIFIDDKELKILPNDKTAVVQDSLKIKPEFFSNITEGQHKLKVTAIDEFELKADKILILNFDTSTPKIINSAIPINFKKLEFEKGKSITVNLSESVEKLETLINNSPWGLKLGTDKKSFTIKSNGKIKETAQNYSVIFYDLAGNKNGIIGSISFKSERDKILLQNYNKSILTKTGSLKDKMMLVNRPEFMLNTTDPIDLVPRKKKKKIKKKLNFLTKITDPFLYQLKLE